MKYTALIEKINKGELDENLASLYGCENVAATKARYINAIEEFVSLYGADRDVSLFSVAGRSELSGNHTDHNKGCVVAASISLDIIAVAAPRNDNTVCIKSEGFPEDCVDLDAFTTPRTERFDRSDALIAGVATGFRNKGYRVGGFDAYTTSNVLKGSGISSSAAFEDMVGNILNHIYNDGKIDNVEIAKLSQYAENVFFGKPCGLMDQVACAVGGIVGIDFADPTAPVIEKIDFDITAAGYNLCIINTGGNHADLTDDYASIPREMKAVAAQLGKTVLREVDVKDLIAAVPALRRELGDRAVLRAFHFLAENDRVAMQTKALKAGDLETFFANVLASGRSSFCYLQNVFTTKNVAEQGVSLSLCLAEQYLADKAAAWRVHGGGFAGTIQAFVPSEHVEGFRAYMDAVLGEGHCMVLRIRPVGAVKI